MVFESEEDASLFCRNAGFLHRGNAPRDGILFLVASRRVARENSNRTHSQLTIAIDPLLAVFQVGVELRSRLAAEDVANGAAGEIKSAELCMSLEIVQILIRDLFREVVRGRLRALQAKP